MLWTWLCNWPDCIFISLELPPLFQVRRVTLSSCCWRGWQMPQSKGQQSIFKQGIGYFQGISGWLCGDEILESISERPWRQLDATQTTLESVSLLVPGRLLNLRTQIEAKHMTAHFWGKQGSYFYASTTSHGTRVLTMTQVDFKILLCHYERSRQSNKRPLWKLRDALSPWIEVADEPLRGKKAAEPPKFSECQYRKCHQTLEPHSRVGKEANHYIRWEPSVFHTTKQGSKSDRVQTEKKSGMMEYVIKPMPLWKCEWVVTLLFCRQQQNFGQIMLIHYRIFKHILC